MPTEERRSPSQKVNNPLRGQYLIFGGLIVVAGIVLMVLGARTGGKKKEKSIPLSTCKNRGTRNPVASEFCAKCGIKNV